METTQQKQYKKGTVLAGIFFILMLVCGGTSYRFKFGGETGFSQLFETFNQALWADVFLVGFILAAVGLAKYANLALNNMED